MKRTAVLNVVGLTSGLMGKSTPHLNQLLQGGQKAFLEPVFPALTCSAQSTYLTGQPPSGHGIVGNGWYNRELAEVQFWKQSNHLVCGRKLWEEVRETQPGFTCAKLFWWYNMYSTADYSITPRPMYPADGRKVFDIYTHPFSIRPAIKADLGEFPFPCFWGPAAGRQTPQGAPDAVSRWIAEAAKWIERRYKPTLSLVYLPHLDYNLQRLGPAHPDIAADVAATDAIVGDLLTFFRERSVQVVVLSEYGITAVEQPVHINRVLREHGWVAIKDELGRDMLDAGASKAFAVADHQVAHVYVLDPDVVPRIRQTLEALPGVARVLDRNAQAGVGIDHPRSGDLIAVASSDAWFTYYYWTDDEKAPDFARTVDIHRKPGYDPVELFLDPALRHPRLRIAWRLLQKKLGFRMLMNVIPLDATLVKGSHGAKPGSTLDWPIMITERGDVIRQDTILPTQVYEVLRELVQ